MKKIISTLLVCALIFSLCACGNNTKTQNNATPEPKIEVDACNVQLLNCTFADQIILGVDKEISSWGFEDRDGKTYVDLALKIANNSEEPFTKDDITAYFEYNGDKYEMQFAFGAVSPTRDGDDILPGCVGIIHMIDDADDAITNEDITVHYTIKGTDFEEKVGPKDTRDILSTKTKVSVGDKLDANGLYEVEVISCGEKEEITASDVENSEKYVPLKKGDKFIELILKVKNNTDVTLEASDVDSYIIFNDGEATRTKNQFENAEHNDLRYSGLEAGQEELLHIYTSTDASTDTSKLFVRFDIGTECYYIPVQ